MWLYDVKRFKAKSLAELTVNRGRTRFSAKLVLKPTTRNIFQLKNERGEWLTFLGL